MVKYNYFAILDANADDNAMSHLLWWVRQSGLNGDFVVMWWVGPYGGSACVYILSWPVGDVVMVTLARRGSGYFSIWVLSCLLKKKVYLFFIFL